MTRRWEGLSMKEFIWFIATVLAVFAAVTIITSSAEWGFLVAFFFYLGYLLKMAIGNRRVTRIGLQKITPRAMNPEKWIIVALMVAVIIFTIYALYAGIDGNVLKAAFSALSGLAAYLVKGAVDAVKLKILRAGR